MKHVVFALSAVVAAFAIAGDLRAQIAFTSWSLPPGAELFETTLISNDGLIYTRTSGGGSRVWLLGEDGVFVAPDVPPGYGSSTLLGINHQGYGTGSVYDGSVGTPAVRSPDGSWLTPMPGVSGTAHGVSNAGAVVGFTTMWGPNAAFLHDPGSGATLIPMPPGASARPAGVGITGHGVVFGTAYVPNGPWTGRSHAFRYTPESGAVLLDTPPGQASEVAAANDSGVIVGVVGGLGHNIQPVKWLADGTAEELTGIAAGFVTAQGINNRGDVVGMGFSAGARAVLWSDDYGAIDLNTLLTAQQRVHWELRFAFDINDHRQIVGTALYYPDGPTGPAPRVNELYMLTLPHMPEPASASMLLLGFTILLRRRA